MLEPHKRPETQSVKSELNIKQVKPSKLVMVDNVEPKNNHIIYEIDQFKRTIRVAMAQNKKILHWFEIIDGSWKSHEIIKTPGCVYISSLNKNNVIQKVRKLFGIDISSYDYLSDKGVVGSNLKVKIMEKQTLK